MKKNLIKIIIGILAMLIVITGVYSFNVQVVKTNPAPIIAGDYADITLRFTNPTTNVINDVSIKIGKNSQIYPLKTDDLFLAKVGGLESLTKTFRVFFSKNIPEGFINLPINIKLGSLNTQNQVSIYVQATQSNPEFYVGQINSIPNELLPDTKDNKLSLTLQNLGNKNAQLVRVELIANKKLIKSSNSYSLIDSVASIPAGSQGILNFKIDVEKGVEGNIPAKLKLRYRAQKSINGTYDTFEKILNFSIQITNSPYLKIVKVEELNNFAIGTSENIVRVTLKNIGNKEARQVKVRAVPDSSYPFAYEKLTQYVAPKIAINQEVSIDFKVEVLSVAQVRNYPTTLLLESLVGQTRYTQEDFMNLKVTGKKPSNNFTLGYLIVGVVIVISMGLGLFRILNRRRNKK